MRTTLLAPFIILSFLIPVKALAWGKNGHEIVAQIAMQYLKAPARKNIAQWLQGESIEQTATWMDDIKSEHINAYMNKWHYINIDQGQSYNTADTPNVVSKLNEVFQELKRPLNNPDPKMVHLDLRILFHLMGDLHQPLHVGYGADKGGNQAQVRFGNKGTNLHHVWDTDIIESQKITLNDCLALGKTLSGREIQHIRKIDFLSWMNESRSLLNEAYGYKDNKLDEGYIARSRGIIVRQLLYAGIRLAAILDQAVNRSSPTTSTSFPPGEKSAKNGVAGRKIYTAADAPELIGEKTCICGKIIDSRTLEEDKGIVFFFDAPEATSTFSIVIFSKYYAKFSFTPARYLNNRPVCVTGFIKKYKGRAEMIIKSEKQIEIH